MSIVDSALANLPSNVAVMKLENDTIQSMAIAKPRDRDLIIADLKDQVDKYPNFAVAAVYCRPVGKLRRCTCDCGNSYDAPLKGKTICPRCQSEKPKDIRERMKFARGLSIRAAEALAEVYKYNRVRADVTLIDDTRVKVEATFTDFQNGRIWQDAGICSRKFKDANGQMQEHDEARFYNTVVKAEVSRHLREVITRSIPPGLRGELQEICERKSSAALTPEKMEKIIEYFGERGVSLAQLETYIGRTFGQGWTEEDRIDLLGIQNALKDNELSIDEVFGPGSPAGKTDERGQSKVGQSSLGDGKKK